MSPPKKNLLPNTPLTVSSPSQEPVWKGPVQDGISQTMISRYLSCPERFRILYIEGLQPTPTFNPRLEFGNLWHEAEEKFALHGECTNGNGERFWQRAVYDYGNKLGELYPMQRDQIIHWLKVTVALFPVYIQHWANHPEMLLRTPLFQEKKFAVDYRLPSGRNVKLRGKWDSVDLVKNPTLPTRPKVTTTGIWLQENKTKSSIDRDKIDRQLRYDLQTMLYLIALSEYHDWDEEAEFPADSVIKGVRYNVIRRGSHKTAESMTKKVQEDMKDGRDAEWFARWNVEISADHMETFKRQTLNPLLENVLDDYEWWDFCVRKGRAKTDNHGQYGIFDYEQRKHHFPNHYSRHFVMPYVGYNPLTDGGESDVDNYLFTGSEIGLQRITNCFPEL